MLKIVVSVFLKCIGFLRGGVSEFVLVYKYYHKQLTLTLQKLYGYQISHFGCDYQRCCNMGAGFVRSEDRPDVPGA